MKTHAGLLMALLLMSLFATGLAQEYFTLPEIREQAAEGWHETYTDRYGRQIAVDVDVQVFGGERAPVLKAKPAEGTLNCALLSEDTIGKDGHRIELYRNNPADAVFMTKAGEQPLIVYHTYGEKIDMDRRYMEEFGTTLTMREMVDHLCSILREHGISAEDYVFDQPKEFSVRCKVNKNTLDVVEPAIYLAHFWPTLDELPILTHASNAFYRMDWPDFEPQMVLGMRGEAEYSICIDALEETQRLAEDIPLCSVQAVIDCLEASIEDGYIRRVFDVMFGYVVYNDPNLPKDLPSSYDAEGYYLTPSWVVHCIYMENPKKEYVYGGKQEDELEPDEKNGIGYKTLIINAQSAQMLDPYDTSKKGHGDSDYQGFLSWEDVP